MILFKTMELYKTYKNYWETKEKENRNDKWTTKHVKDRKTDKKLC